MQIENEYGMESKAYGAAGRAYINWAAKMAVGLDTGVPWVMCKENDAPDPVVSNSFILKEKIHSDILQQIFPLPYSVELFASTHDKVFFLKEKMIIYVLFFLFNP